MRQQDAEVIVEVVQLATETIWPQLKSNLLDLCGYDPQEVVEASKALAEEAGTASPITSDDF